MLAVQERLPLVRQRTRSSRRSFTPAQGRAGYRLPHEVRDRLVGSLAPYRNREAAFALAVFLARFWSMPGRVALPFVIDRVALANRPDLGLSEARIRGAIKTLEAIGFLDRWPTTGSAYRATEHGLRRKPVGFTFGSDYMPAFIAANTRAAAACGRREGARRTLEPQAAQGPSLASPEARPLKSPEHKSEAETKVYSGEIVRGGGIPPRASVPNANLEAALERLRKAAGIAGDGSGEGGAR